MNKKQTLSVLALAVIAVGSALVLANGHESEASIQATDDAYVQVDVTRVAARVSGVVAQVAVQSYQAVQAGDPLFMLDDRDLRNALQQAQAAVASAQAAVGQGEAQLKAQGNVILQAQAVLGVDDANLALAMAEQKRFANLAALGSGSEQDSQQADAVLGVQKATRMRDEQALKAAQQQEAVLAAQLESARAALLAAQAGEAQARLNLSYATVVAPVAGVVAERQARVGGFIAAGEAQITLVPLDAVYVEASFRETQLANIAVGQAVDIAVDALPGVELAGRVASLGPASGVSVSAVAAHNASGNFTKIVQRLPVRISIDANQPAAARLRAGMSVYPQIHTGS